MEKNIAEQLLRGSQNIDRMRKEVECVVSMILGFLVPGEENFCATFDFDGGKWEIEISYSYNISMPIARCWLRKPFESTLAYINKSRELPMFKVGFNHEMVQEVHQNLPVFVLGMMKEFPELERQLKPFLDAADKFPPAK
jgi:hypothetical protein